MKKTIIVTLLLSLCVGYQANAQILKKLGDKASQAAERALERKTEEKVEQTTEDTVDEVFEAPKKMKKKKKRKKSKTGILSKTDKVPSASYSFTHKYVLEISAQKDKMLTTYYLSNGQNYIGSKTSLNPNSNEGVMTIMDNNQKAIFSLMDMSGQKIMMAQNMDFEDLDDETNPEDVSINKTGKTKTILGYHCEEFTVTGNQFKSNIWVTQQADVQFLNIPSSQKNKSSFNSKWFDYADGLVMEMTMTDTSEGKPQKMTIRCVELTKEAVNINTTEYKSYGF